MVCGEESALIEATEVLSGELEGFERYKAQQEVS